MSPRCMTNPRSLSCEIYPSAGFRPAVNHVRTHLPPAPRSKGTLFRINVRDASGEDTRSGGYRDQPTIPYNPPSQPYLVRHIAPWRISGPRCPMGVGALSRLTWAC